MGLFKGAKDAMQNMQQQAGGMAGMPAGVSMPTGMPDPAYVAKVNKIGKSGVQAPGEIVAVREAGAADMSGGVPHDFDVHVKPEGLAEYDTTIHQSIQANQVPNLTVGKAVTVKYDPDNPVDALLSSW
jgi:hypothetical protein